MSDTIPPVPTPHNEAKPAPSAKVIDDVNTTRSEKFNNIASGIQAIVVAVGVVVGGGWGLWRYSVLLEARIAVAQAEKAEAEVESAKRVARSSVVVNVDLSARQIQTTLERGKWILVELSIRNTGNQDIKIDLTGDTRFYVARVTGINKDGALTFDDRAKSRCQIVCKKV
jgi:hypothetical protein